MARVYVSSTIADLAAERQAVIDWLVAAQHQVVHSYRPSSDTVRDGCLADVDACDVYVLIVGHRYGFQPPEENPEGLSITQLEFRRAGQKGKPRVALLRTSIPDVSLSDVADPVKASLVFAFRAEVAGAVRAAEFGDLRGLVQGLSTGVQAELEKAQAERARQPAAPVSGGWVVRLAPRPLFLAGREDLLAELEARLSAGDGREPRVVVLYGLAGAGKTSVALAYAHTHLTEGGITWQFEAEDPAVLAAGFTEVAVALGAQERAGDPVVAVHRALAGSAAGWLLVFDNAPGPEAVEAFVPAVGKGRVLITSRNALWPPGQALEVPILDREAAAGFLTARTGDTDRQAAAAVAEAVGGLPLALEQAAAYAQATGASLDGYLALFHKRRADLLARGQPARYGGTVAATWALAFTQLQDSDPGAAGLLRLLAFCAPDAVPLRLLLRPRPGLAEQLSPEVALVLVPLLEDELAAGDAVAALRRYSLARPAGGGAVSVHRLVQAVTADQIPEELRDAWRQAAAAVIEAAIPPDPVQSAAWPVFAAVLPHAQAVVSTGSEAMGRIADYLWHSGSYAAARDLYRSMFEERVRVLGPEHPRTLAARANAAHLTGKAGDAAAARDQFDALLPVYERVSGPHHPDALTTRAKLARFTGEAGDAAGARDQFAALLPVYERVLGPDHPDTLAIVRADLARFTGEAGDAAGARDQYAALLVVAERVFGPEHPETVSDRANMARFTGEAGDVAGARDQFAALLPVSERLLGPGHPNTLLARARLARFTGEAGDAAGARDQYAALLPVIERVLGAEHPDTLSTRASIARWTGPAGDSAAARDQYAALLPVRERVLGPDHPETLATRQNLAKFTGRAGNPAGARDQYAALLPDYERVLGPEHPETLTVRSSLASWTGEAGDPACARDQCIALLPVIERVSGPEHPATLATRQTRAYFTGEAGDPAAARDQYIALLPVLEQASARDHPDVLTARGSLAYWTGQAGDPARARDQYAALLPVAGTVLGPEHPATLDARDYLAYYTGETGDPATARDHYIALLPVIERVLGPEHPATLAARASLARWTGEAGDPATARDQLAALLPIRKRVSGPEHPATLAARASLAHWTMEADGSAGCM